MKPKLKTGFSGRQAGALVLGLLLCLAPAGTIWCQQSPSGGGESAESGGAEFYTMEESIERALEVNPRISAAESEVSRAEAKSGRMRGDYFPTLSAQSSVQSINSLDSEGPADEDYLDQWGSVSNLRLSQSLFEGFTVFNKHQKSVLGREVAEARKKQAEKDLVLEIQTRFLELLKAKEDVDSLRDSVDRLEVNLASAEAFHGRQMLSYSEVLQAEVDLADARQEMNQAEKQVEVLRGELNIFLGFAPARKIRYQGGLSRRGGIDMTMEQCLSRAREKRPEMRIAEKSIDMAEKEKEIAMGGLSPRLSADADYNYRHTDYDEPGESMGQTYDRDQTNSYWSVSLRLQWDFGLGGQQIYQHRETFHELERLRANRRDTLNTITSEVRSEFLSLREAAGRIVSTQKAVEAAGEAYRRSQKRFEVKIGTISELLDAQSRFSRAESNQNQAVADYLLSLARLNRAIGRDERKLVKGES